MEKVSTSLWRRLGKVSDVISLCLGAFVAIHSRATKTQRHKDAGYIGGYRHVFELCYTYIWLLAAGLIIGCSQKPEPINYGEDGCHHCKMTIMDNRYGSEIVTEKGKVLKFDAIECMLNFQRENSTDHQKSLFLVTDFTDPGNLIEAESAYFLRSASLPSPMGMFLTSCSSEQAANDLKDTHQGTVYSWQNLKSEFPDFTTLNHQAE